MTDTDTEVIPETLGDLRKRKKVTQLELGRRLGIYFQTIVDIENGRVTLEPGFEESYRQTILDIAASR